MEPVAAQDHAFPMLPRMECRAQAFTAQGKKVFLWDGATYTEPSAFNKNVFVKTAARRTIVTALMKNSVPGSRCARGGSDGFYEGWFWNIEAGEAKGRRTFDRERCPLHGKRLRRASSTRSPSETSCSPYRPTAAHGGVSAVYVRLPTHASYCTMHNGK